MQISVLHAIVDQGEARSYPPKQILAVLTLAIDESWTAATDVPGMLDALDALPHSTIDFWYNLAALRGWEPNRWQEYKNRLYRHMKAAQALLDGEDPEVPSDAEWQQLRADVDKILDVVQDNQTQLRGPGLKGWEQLGQNDRGQNLTLVDAFAAFARKLFG